MLESVIQTKIIKHLTDNGFIAMKLVKTNMNGISDIIAFKGKSYLFIEVKQESGRESPLQAQRRKQFTDQGSDWIVVYGFVDYLQKISPIINLMNTCHKQYATEILHSCK